MQIKELIKILSKCNPEDEITFIFDSNKRLSWNRGDGLFEVSQINVTGVKINNKIALTNGASAKLTDGTEKSIFRGE